MNVEQQIVKYLSGEASCEEIILISDWLKENKENELLFREICAYWNAKVTLTTEIDYHKSWDQLISRIAEEEEPVVVKKINLNWLYTSAAAAILIIGMLWIWNPFQANVSVNSYTYLSGKSVSELSLPDGTKVSLNRNSVLKYDNSFGGDLRNVSLEGEAFFEVKKDVTKPFIVDLNGTRITVLGTSFNVRSRASENEVSATLVTGKIKFDTNDQSVLLKPNYQLVFDKTSKKINIKTPDISTVVAWKDNLIKYDSLPFYKAVKLLEEQYTVRIQIADSELGNTLTTGAFDRGLNLDQILDLMKNNIGFKWEKIGTNQYKITK